MHAVDVDAGPPEATGSGTVRRDVQGWVDRAVAILWVVQLAPWLIVGPGLPWRTGPEVWLVAGSYSLYLAAACWSLVRVQRGRRLGRPDVIAWVAAMACCELLVGLVLPAGTLATWANWTPAPSTGVALLARVAGGGRTAAATVTVLGGIYVLTALRDLRVAPDHLPTIIGVVAQLAAFTYGFGLIAAKLLATAHRADASTEAMLVERESKVRVQERARQYEMLHTTVLTTLTVVARTDGPVSPALRARCAREAEYLRAVVHSVVAADSSDLEAALAEAVFAQSALGLTIHHNVDELPDTVPEAVVRAVVLGVREALNNVAKHAEVHEAWVTAVGDDTGGVQIVVADRGVGYPADVVAGVGTTRSLRGNLHDVGAAARIRSSAAGGTRVEIVWQPR